MEVRFNYYHQTTVGTAGASGRYTIKLPSGYTIDPSYYWGAGNSNTAVGVASGDLGGGSQTNFTLGVNGTTLLGVMAAYSSSGVYQFGSAGTYVMTAQYLAIAGSFTVPIAQWTTNNNLVTYVIKY